jgi:hypothetical protein
MQVHARDPMRLVPPQGFACERVDNSKGFFGSGEGNRDGFKAALYRDSSAARVKVLAIAGTQGMALNDIADDVRIPLHVMPHQASSAWKFYRSVVRDDDEFVFIVGHSLGGALAQVLGYWCNRPFVTFNAPGMASIIKAAQWNFLKPDVFRRTREAKKFRADGKARGINFRISGDAIAKFGRHVGDMIVLNSSGPFTQRHIDFERALQESRLNGQQTLYDVDPFLLTEGHLAALA